MRHYPLISKILETIAHDSENLLRYSHTECMYDASHVERVR